jgi:hypothetical protein
VATDSTTRRLRAHAGLGELGAVAGPTVSEAIIEPVNADDLGAALSSFIDALDALNHEINGAEPSAVLSRKASVVSRDAAYAIAEVAPMLRDASCERDAWAVDENCDGSRARDADRLPIRPASGRQADTGLSARTNHWKDTAPTGRSRIESQTDSTGPT